MAEYTGKETLEDELVKAGYNNWVADALAGRGNNPTYMAHMSLHEALNEVLEWHGIIGFTTQIINAVDNLRNQGHD